MLLRLGDDLAEQFAARGDDDGLARLHVAHAREAQDVQRRGFGGDDVLGALAVFAFAQHQRADAVRVAERHQAQAQHHADDGVAALHAAVHAGHGTDRGLGAERALQVQFVGEHVQQHFAVRIGIDVATVLREHVLAQRVGVDQVAVVRQRDAVRRVHVERLRFVHAFGTGGGIAAVGDAHAPFQHAHRLGVEHVPHQSVVLVHAQARAVGGGDAGGVLSAVLEDGQPVIKLAGNVLVADDSDDAAHGDLLRFRLGRSCRGDALLRGAGFFQRQGQGMQARIIARGNAVAKVQFLHGPFRQPA